MRSLEEARAAWSTLQKETSLERLGSSVRGLAAQPEAHGLRSAQWKAFLVLKTVDYQKWPSRLGEARSAYASMKKAYLHGLNHQDEQDSLDPLSDDVQSPWNALRQDEQARQEIYQDVARCMPENLYFRKPETQQMLLDVLFVWAKMHPDIAYRQGMHEILAPIIWVVERDAVDSPPSDEACGAVFDAAFIEHDAFTIFNAIMSGLQSAYAPPGPPVNRQPAEPPIVPRSNHIVRNLLEQVDPSLSRHLVDIDIAPQLFIMRWIRLLFGREFEFDDMLRVWDRIFAEDASPAIIDLVCLSMLLRIRWQLIDAGYNEALTTLLKYPAMSRGQTAASLVEDALFLREHLTLEAGNRVIIRYSGRAPGLIHGAPSPVDRLRKPGMRSPVRRSPLHSRESSNLEGLLQNAARGVLSRGEFLNKAVKDAVGDFRENVQHLRAPRADSTETATSDAGSDGTNGGEKDLMKHIDELQARNKALAKMLETAVTDLWKEHKQVVADRPAEDERSKSFTMAIAKVQLAQVYLDDTSLPLPPDVSSNGDGPPSSNGAASKVEITPRSPLEPPTSTSTTVVSVSDASNQPEVAFQSSENVEDPFDGSSNLNKVPIAGRRSVERPRLGQSSYSFMLGQDTPKAPSPAPPPAPAPKPAPPAETSVSQDGSRGLDFLFGGSKESSFVRRSFESKSKRKPAKSDEVMFDAESMSDVKLND